MDATSDLLNSARCGYQLTVRVAGPDTTPDGVDRELHAENLPGYESYLCPVTGRALGHVSYAEPLSPAIIHHYDLIPLTELAALNGLQFTEAFLGYTFTHQVSVTVQGMVKVASECDGLPETNLYAYADFLKRQQEDKWQELVPFCNNS